MASVHTAQASPGARDIASSPADPKPAMAAQQSSLPRRHTDFEDVYQNLFPGPLSGSSETHSSRENNTLSPMRGLVRPGIRSNDASPGPAFVTRPREILTPAERAEETSVSISVAVVSGKSEAEPEAEADEVEKQVTTEVKTTTVVQEEDDKPRATLGSPVLRSRPEEIETSKRATTIETTNGASDAHKDGEAASKPSKADDKEERPDETSHDKPVANGDNAAEAREADEKDARNAKDGEAPEEKKDQAEPPSKVNPPVAEEIHEVDRLASHRINKDTSTVDFKVEWVDAGSSWEPERELQLQVPKLVIAYWDSLGGRDKATGLEEYHVLRIIDSEAGRPPMFRVHWVGFRATAADTTWESKELLERIAPASLRQFEAEKKKRSATKGKVGRPAKKAKLTGR